MFHFFKKKKEEEIIGLYKVGDEVAIIQTDFTSILGVVYSIYKGEDGEILYQINVGGECPYLKKGVKESDLKRR